MKTECSQKFFYKKYNIALIPNQAQEEYAIIVSQMLEKYGGAFVLNRKKRFPHVSLYQIPMDPIMFESLAYSIQIFLQSVKIFPLIFEGYRTNRNGEWVYAKYVRDEKVQNLHWGIIEFLKEFWSRSYLEDYRESRKAVSYERKKSLEWCGWDEAGELFNPHLTFTKLYEPNLDVTGLVPQYDFSFIADTIGIFDLDEYGTCTNLLKKISLKRL